MVDVLFLIPRKSDMADIFEQLATQGTFRLELKKNEDGREYIEWHGRKNGENHTWFQEPYTSFFRRLGIGIMGLFPIESQL